MIVDDIRAALPQMQAQAESLMITPCRVRRPGPDGTSDSGATISTYLDPDVYTGGCKVQNRDAQTLSEESADATAYVQRLEVHLPAASGPYRIGDVVFAAGLQLRIVGLSPKTFQTAQRLPVEVTG